MKVELHLLQNFPPSCLNRDDTNSPKDCEFGGVRRARISSQSLKRAIRQDFGTAARIPTDELAVRTKRVVEHVADLVEAKAKHDRDQIETVIEGLLASAGFAVKKAEGADTKTQYLLFVPRRNLETLASLVHERWAELSAQLGATPTEDTAPKKADAKSAKKDKKKASEAASARIDEAVRGEVEALLFGAQRTPELALFGRMIADKPEHNVDAACQVAHAISTHRVAMEFDFYTAVDDLKPKADSGADMMGTIQFNSACFYRYSVLDLDQLARTLAGLKPSEPITPADRKAASTAARAWLEASVHAIPSARQNGFAAFTPPQVILTGTRRKGAPLSLANAFVAPVRPGREDGEDLVTRSAQALNDHLAELSTLYGGDDVTFRVAAAHKELRTTAARAIAVDSFPELVQAIGADLAAWENSP